MMKRESIMWIKMLNKSQRNVEIKYDKHQMLKKTQIGMPCAHVDQLNTLPKNYPVFLKHFGNI